MSLFKSGVYKHYIIEKKYIAKEDLFNKLLTEIIKCDEQNRKK